MRKRTNQRNKKNPIRITLGNFDTQNGVFENFNYSGPNNDPQAEIVSGEEVIRRLREKYEK